MLNRLVRSLSPALLLSFAVACGTDGAPVVVEEGCSSELCLAADVDTQASTVAPVQEECVPAEEQTFENDPSGLSIARVAPADDGHSLVVELANNSSLGVYSYPGTRLRVIEGDAKVFENIYGYEGEPGDEAAWQLYGIGACGSDEHLYGIVWGEEPTVRLEAVAFDSLGEVVIHEVSFVVTRQ